LASSMKVGKSSRDEFIRGSTNKGKSGCEGEVQKGVCWSDRGKIDPESGQIRLRGVSHSNAGGKRRNQRKTLGVHIQNRWKITNHEVFQSTRKEG